MGCDKIGMGIAKIRTAGGIKAHFPRAKQKPIGRRLARNGIGFAMRNVEQAGEELRLYVFHAAFKFIGHDAQLLPASMKLLEGFRHAIEFAR